MRVPLQRLTAGLLVFLFIMSPFGGVYAQEDLVPAEIPVIGDEPTVEVPVETPATSEGQSSEESLVEGQNETQNSETANSMDSEGESQQAGEEEDPKMPAENNLKKKPAIPDEASGALIYSYPLSIAPGRNGMQPDINLFYNSQSRDLHSWFGQGWSISIPYIELMNKKGIDKMYVEPTYYSSLSDELVDLNNGQFGSKVDNGEFLKYSFEDQKWIVLDKEGKKYTFGSAATSRQDDPVDPNRIFKWMIEEIRDTNDNFIRFEYFKDQGQIYPSKIFYTGNGSTEGIFEIDFLRETRPDQYFSSKAGFTYKTAYRINEIQSKINGAWSKKYVLSYITGDNDTNSLLSSISETGTGDNGIKTLPPTTFEYQASGAVHWEVDSTNWTTPVRIDQYSGVMVGDLNGDGLDDLIKSHFENNSQGGVWTKGAYLNNGQGGFIINSGYEPPIYFHVTAYGEEHDEGVRLIDINADGLLDLLRYGSGINAYINTGSGWQINELWTPPLRWNYYVSDISSYIVNLNGDNLPDFIGTSQNGGPLLTYAYINNGVDGWVRDLEWQAPYDFRITNGSTFADLNGDGLDDIIQSYSGLQNYKRAFLNTGKKGWVEAAQYVPTEAGYFFNSTSDPHSARDNGYRLVDLNGDSLPDILKQGYGANINNGNGWNSPNDLSWDQRFELEGTTSSLPYLPYISNMNGDGMADIHVAKFNNNNNQIETTVVENIEPRVNLIKKINYNTGGSTSITYKSTPLYRNGTTLLNPNLSMIIDTVYQISTNDSSGNNSTIEYSYEGGYYYYGGAFDTKLAGFSKVIKTEDPASPLNRTISHYHQGNDSNSGQGEYDDHISKVGKKYREEIYDSNWNLQKKVINTWDKLPLSNGRHFVRLANTLESIYDGNSSHKDRAESFGYDADNGNKIEITSWGEVNGQDNGVFIDTGSDKYLTTIVYASNPTNYVIGLPAYELIKDQSETKIKETLYYYDGLGFAQVDKGNRTMDQFWRAGSKYIDIERTYNNHGLVISEKDARDKESFYAYDIYNLYPLTITNPLSQVTTYEYDYSSGQPTRTIDPNNRSYYTDYDGLDRVIAERQPDVSNPTVSLAKISYEYVDTPNAVRTKKIDHLDANNAVETYTYFDGLGRKIQERQEAETSGLFNVRDFVYSKNDLLLKESLPYISSGSAKTSPSSEIKLYTRYTYDAMKRVVTATVATDWVTTNTYDDWKTTVTDAKGKVKDLYRDAYDNLVRVDEHNGSSIYTTNYQWNGLKKLVKITDALNNERNFTYDGLGRVLSAEDLHAWYDGSYGVWAYSYDNAGNLVGRTDPKGINVVYVYDYLNRLISEDANADQIFEVTNVYDSCTDGIGRLCTVTTPDINVSYSYNALGQTVAEEKNIDQTSYVSQYFYDRQGNRVIVTNPDNSEIKYFYNAAGLVDQIERKEANDPGYTDVISNIDYNSVALPTMMAYANGATTTNTYDADKLYRLHTKVTVADGQDVQHLTYTYDPVGNITRIIDASDTITAKTTDYTYDDLHRLLSATITNSAQGGGGNDVQTFTYDAIGNILTKSDVGSYSYDGASGIANFANPHAVTSAGSLWYAYDANGNMIEVNGFQHNDYRTYSWDYNNRLASVTTTNGTSTYAYNASGQRIKATDASGTTLSISNEYSVTPAGIEKHIFLGDTAIATVSSSEESTSVYNIHADHLTGSNVITNHDEQVDELTDYRAFGTMRIDEQYGEHAEKRKFTGHEYDVDTGLTYANARYYSGTMGRWLSQDNLFLAINDSDAIESESGQTYLEYLSNPQNLNSYSYVINNPLKYQDITGETYTEAGKGFAVGMGQGLWGTIKGTANSIAHPITATKNMANAAVNGGKAWQQLISDLSKNSKTTVAEIKDGLSIQFNEFMSKSDYEKGRIMGQATEKVMEAVAVKKVSEGLASGTLRQTTLGAEKGVQVGKYNLAVDKYSRAGGGGVNLRNTSLSSNRYDQRIFGVDYHKFGGDPKPRLHYHSGKGNEINKHKPYQK